jgi:hypothetical protein
MTEILLTNDLQMCNLILPLPAITPYPKTLSVIHIQLGIVSLLHNRSLSRLACPGVVCAFVNLGLGTGDSEQGFICDFTHLIEHPHL